ncbi:helix-turn-helix domain-containing protein [Conexibacter sp. JD483]|uniref:helix-turn-helix domain-containing protein n=1 Tax=unclassified Conexibacter TaxID=2627773 RepID=UPI00271FE0AC|nr:MULTISPECIES: helix-turn-helix domain-containing protein [unclassified Conexibacter]MDO8188089.1 helix-turn-helix domain-containing protein [Conexibacter sp. CPCC 205706]MDO8196915.1 helix-turn-helix domain-containing protein [Conexibacter sp. CPCC 205762]MDR9370044.1 helix-turn-helix domain-containing protein [Conexibacter sp. JD483]
MPEIGPTLREARMRARIDITEVELATKIRAKYLRAIENEEWQLLPGSTFAKSFIRTYADYLGIDSRSLVEEYKLRYERPSEQELRTVSPGLARDRRGNRTSPRGGGGGGGGAPRWAITVGLLVILVAALYFIGTRGRDDKGSNTTPTETQPIARRGGGRRAASGGGTGAQTQRRAAAPTLAGLRLIPSGDVYVCLVDQDDRVLIPGQTFAAGQAVPLQRARSMRLTLGNSNVVMRVNGRAVSVPASSEAVGFAITTRGATPISGDQLPTCT